MNICSIKTTRYDAISHHLRIKNFTQKNLLRLCYHAEQFDEKWISVNALRLNFTSLEQNKVEIVYVYYNNKECLIRRSNVVLQLLESSDEYCMIEEIVLSEFCNENIIKIIDLYHSLIPNTFEFNLTQLRKIASNKHSTKSVHRIFIDFELIEGEIETKYTKHELELSLYNSIVLIKHSQWRNDVKTSCDLLAKNDILAFVEFLKIEEKIFNLQNNLDVFKLSNVGDKIALLKATKKSSKKKVKEMY